MSEVERISVHGRLPPNAFPQRLEKRRSRLRALRQEKARKTEKPDDFVTYEESEEEDEGVAIERKYLRTSYNFIDYIRSREMGMRERRCVNFDFASRHILSHEMFKEHPISLNNINKIFCSQWLSDRQVVFGTKCNKLMVYDVVTQKLDQIPLLSESASSGISQDQQCGIHTVQINPSRSLLATGAKNSSDIAIYRLPTMDPVCIGDVRVFLNIFRQALDNLSLSKPLKPITNISVASESNESKQTHPVAINAVLPLQNDKLVIAYGSPPFLSFEILSLNENLQENVVLIRQDKKKVPTDDFNSKTKFPVTSNDVTYQVPSIALLKRGNKKQMEVPLEERLENLALVNPQSSEGPKKDNMAQLLLQGLQSKDRNILQSVLFRTEQSVIDVTVKHLPVQALTPLIRELTSLMHGKTFTSKCAVHWLNSIVRTHSGILLSNPELTNLLEPMMASIEARIAVLPPLLRLSGRLSLVTQQIGNNMEENTDSLSEPLFTYQEDESSDEGDLDKMSEGSGTDSEDNWDEYSEMGDEREEENDEKI